TVRLVWWLWRSCHRSPSCVPDRVGSAGCASGQPLSLPVRQGRRCVVRAADVINRMALRAGGAGAVGTVGCTAVAARSAALWCPRWLAPVGCDQFERMLDSGNVKVQAGSRRPGDSGVGPVGMPVVRHREWACTPYRQTLSHGLDWPFVLPTFMLSDPGGYDSRQYRTLDKSHCGS